MYFINKCATINKNFLETTFKKGMMKMKSTGIVRRLDELGRIVVPIDIRNKLSITEKDPMEIYIEGDKIVLRKFETNCVFCGSDNALKEFKDKPVCEDCLKKLQKLSSKETKKK